MPNRRGGYVIVVCIFTIYYSAIGYGMVKLNGVEIPLTGQYQIPSSNSEIRHMLVQFDSALSPAERKSLQELGVGFEQYLSNHTYVLSAPAGIFQELNRGNSVLGITPVPQEAKVDASLRVTLNSSLPKGSLKPISAEAKEVKILFHRNTSFSEAVRILLLYGAQLPTTQTGFDFRETLDHVTIPADRIFPLAQEDSVFLITEPDTPIVPCNINAQDTSNVDEIHPGGLSGYNLDGSGVTVGLWDPYGTRTTHSQLIGRATQEDYGKPTNYHATHVAGTIGASGIENPNIQGMAPNASILCWEASNHLSEMDANAHRIVASNHSYTTSVGWQYNSQDQQWHWYGNTKLSPFKSHLYGRYETLSQSFDQIVYDHDLMVVVSAGNNRNAVQTYWGNSVSTVDGLVVSQRPQEVGGEFDDGYDTINTIALGKNGITVGAIHDRLIEPPTPALDFIASWSSWGPTDDGRIKPDLVANGVKLLSLDSDDDQSTRLLSGTSMASPVVVGTLACLVQQYRQKFYGADPSSAIMKSILLHTVQDQGTSPGPDYRIGWGLLDARAAADFIANIGTNDTYLDIDSYEGVPIELKAEYVGEGPIKVTMVWTDPPGMPVLGGLDDGTPVLVNDLDLSINGPDALHYPWTLDPANPGASAKQDSENHLDNVEQVYIARPEEGPYTIHIGGQLNMDASQNYALCISGLRLLERETKLLVLQPKGQRRTNEIVPIHLFATSEIGITELHIELDGQVFDDPETDVLDGDQRFETLQNLVNHRCHWDTTQVSNGEHTLAVSVTDASGTIKMKDFPLFILNEVELSPLVVAAPLTIGELTNTQDRDWYSIKVSDAGEYTIETQGITTYTAPDTTLVLYGPDTKKQVIAEDDDGGLHTLSKITHYLQTNRTYYVRVSSYTGAAIQLTRGLYGISVKKKDVDEPSQTLIPIVSNGPDLIGEFSDVGDEHWYQFTPEILATHIIEATASEPSPSRSFQFELYDSSELSRPIQQGFFNKPIFRVLSPLKNYLIRVIAPKSTGRYKIALQTLTEFSAYNLTINGLAKQGKFASGKMEEAWYVLHASQFTSYYLEFSTPSETLAAWTSFILYGPDDPATEIVRAQTNGAPNARIFLPLRSRHDYYLQVLTKIGDGEYTIRVLTPDKVFPMNARSNLLFDDLNPTVQTLSESWPESFYTDVADWRLHQ